MFKNPFSFRGRIRRLEYGLSVIIYFIIVCSIEFIYMGIENSHSIFLLLIDFPVLYFLISQGAKRCHDRGNSGWFQLIPFYGFWMLFAKSEVGKNEYGLNPKGIGNELEINNIGISEID